MTDSSPTASRPTIEAVFGPLESALMRVLWANGPSSVAEVTRLVGATRQPAPAYTTVMTVLHRLHQKGSVGRSKYGRQYIYVAGANESDLLDSMSERAVTRLLERFGPSAFRQFALKLGDLDPEIRARLIELAEGKET